MSDSRTTELLPMERFRAALEKRGIEYETDDDECAYGEPRCTVFKAHIGGDREMDIVIVGVKDWYFDGKLTPWLDVEFHNVLTPEQAIAATLGNERDEIYNAGFDSGVKATLQQLEGIMNDKWSSSLTKAESIEEWIDEQWKEYES